MAYVKFKSGRELRGWKAYIVAAPLIIILSPLLVLMCVLALPIIAAAKIMKRVV